jgi:hypothetical protein
MQQRDKQQHTSSEVHVVPSNPTYYPVMPDKCHHSFSEVHVVPSHPSYYPVIQTNSSLYKPQFTTVEYSAFHDDYTKSTMYAPSKSQVMAVGRES